MEKQVEVEMDGRTAEEVSIYTVCTGSLYSEPIA